MQSQSEPDGSLILSYDSGAAPKWLFTVAIACLATAGYDLALGAQGSARLAGLLCGSGLCIVAGLALLEKAWLRADRATRTLIWNRRWALSQRSGITPFDAVLSVIVERTIGDRAVPDRRICLQLADGTTLPITTSFRPDLDGQIARAADLLRQALGKPTDTT